MDITQVNWSPDDASNTSAAPDGAPEGMAASGVNNILRAHQGALKRWYQSTIPDTTGGTSTAYTVSYPVAPTALADGMTHLIRLLPGNGAAATLNVNSLGAKPIEKQVGTAWVPLAAGDFVTGTHLLVTYRQSVGTYRIIGGYPSIRDILTTQGDLLTRNATTNARLAVGASGTVLSSDGTDVSWQRSHDPGDFKWAFRSTEPAGWLFASGRTIGNASSTATARANADTEPLFTHLWNESTNAELQLFTSAGSPVARGVSAAADFAANRKLALPNLSDRFAVGRATMSGSDAGLIDSFDTTVLGKSGGAEEHNHATIASSTAINGTVVGASGGGGLATGFDHQHNVATPAAAAIPPALVLNAFIKL